MQPFLYTNFKPNCLPFNSASISNTLSCLDVWNTMPCLLCVDNCKSILNRGKTNITILQLKTTVFIPSFIFIITIFTNHYHFFKVITYYLCFIVISINCSIFMNYLLSFFSLFIFFAVFFFLCFLFFLQCDGPQRKRDSNTFFLLLLPLYYFCIFFLSTSYRNL